MKDNSNKKGLFDPGSFNLKSFTSRKLALITAAIIILGLLGYFTFTGKFSSTDGIFTKYGPLPNDSMSVAYESHPAAKDYQMEDSNKIVLDLDTLTNQKGTNNSDEKSREGDSINNSDTLVNGIIDKENIFKVNTTYNKIAGIPESNENDLDNGSVDLFLDLLLPNTSDRTSIDKVFYQKTISYKSILKLLSIAGQKILFQDDSITGQMMLDALAETDYIAKILVIDRKGGVVYSTSKTLAEIGSIGSMITFNLAANTIVMNDINEQYYVTTPIYSSYGKIGQVILTFKN